MAKTAGLKNTAVVIDLTPTWSAVLPIYLAAIIDGSPAAQAAAREELTRMAKLADQHVAASKPAA